MSQRRGFEREPLVMMRIGHQCAVQMFNSFEYSPADIDLC
jgi:hypothetical protein